MRSTMRAQFREEASVLLSAEAMGTRMAQINRIIKRKVSPGSFQWARLC